ncbi:MAG: hypothetical protein ACRDSR_08150 [Pseudonocardiaceae bacterium]
MKKCKAESISNLPELDTGHDPQGGALRAILLAWVAVIVIIAALVLWSAT